jgi:serine/threonine protein phosphatase PrpC
MKQTVSFYGVYDGHAGDRAAKYCSAHLLDVLVEHLCEAGAVDDDARCAALFRSFVACDASLIETSAAENW